MSKQAPILIPVLTIKTQADARLRAQQPREGSSALYGERLIGSLTVAQFRRIQPNETNSAAIGEPNGIAIIDMDDSGGFVDPVRGAAGRGPCQGGGTE